MKLGVVIQSGLADGGAHNYEAEFLRLVRQEAETLGISVVAFMPRGLSRPEDGSVKTYRSSAVRMGFAHLRANPLLQQIFSLVGLRYTNLEKKARASSVDALIFSSPNHISLGIVGLPIATTAWDFGHLDLPQASETSLNGLWQWRDELFSKTIPKSVILFCESDATADAATRNFRADFRRIRKIGLLPTTVSSDPEFLDKPHFIYPAMHWPHKNHLMLLEAFHHWRSSSGADAYLVLTGTGSWSRHITQRIRELALEDSVIQAGLLDRSKLFGLIRGSIGLVMPSLMGPSNLPQLEASLVGTPIAMSDIHKMDDLLPNAYLVPASNVDDWSQAFDKLWKREVPSISPSELHASTIINESLQYLAEAVKPWISTRR